MERKNLIPENEKYIKKFQELIGLNRKKGRDHEVLSDYLNARDFILRNHENEINDIGIYNYLKKNSGNYELRDRIFEELEKKVRERVRLFEEEHSRNIFKI